MQSNLQEKGLDKSDFYQTNQVRVIEEGDQLRLEVRWFCRASHSLMGFALACSVVSLFLISQGFSSSPLWPRLFVRIFAIIFSVGSVGLIYLSLKEFLNRTTVFVNGEKIVFWTSPFSWTKPVTYAVTEIANISIEREENHDADQGGRYRTSVNLEFKNGTRVPLTRVQNLNEAMFVESVLEKKLRLQDQPKYDRIQR